jgi:hypothetical protein
VRTRVFFQTENIPVHFFSDVSIELAKIPLGGGSHFNAIGQGSIPELLHQGAERDGSLLIRLFQCCAGIFEIEAVHFLLGQTFQEAEVIYRDDDGKILPTTGDDGSLFPVGGPVDQFRKLFPRFGDIQACHNGVPFVQIVR